MQFPPVAKHRDARDRVRAIGDRHRQIAEHPPRHMYRNTRVGIQQRSRDPAGQARALGHLAQQADPARLVRSTVSRPQCPNSRRSNLPRTRRSSTSNKTRSCVPGCERLGARYRCSDQHSTFGGRARYGYDFVDNDVTAQGGNGHGTHVAGTIADSQYGIAEAATTNAVRMLDNTGSGTSAGVVAGVDWVTRDAVKPAVAISGPLTAVAEAITVGTSTSAGSLANYSNYGRVVDVFAPVAGITPPGTRVTPRPTP